MIKVLELFAGIGACSKALERLGIEHEIVDAVEIDKYAIKSFNAIHGTEFEVQDITKWDKDVEVDLIMHGSPCQDFSVAGKQAGGDIGSGTRSSLMYETIRIVGKLRPKYVVWENVKNLLSKKHKHNFDAYIETMTILGYNSYYQVLNAKDYGIPQNRERVFTISIRRDVDNGSFKFPEKEPLKLRLKDMLEDIVDEKYYIGENLLRYYNRKIEQGWRKELHINEDIATTICNPGRNQINDNFILMDTPKCRQVGQMYGTKVEPNPQAGRIYDSRGISPTLDTCSGGNRMPKIVEEINKRAIHQQDLVQSEDGICRTIPAGTYGSTPHLLKTLVSESNKSLFTESDKQMITNDGNIKRYINSDIVDEFKEGQIADISFPNGYNKGPRVHNECPTINGTTVKSFIVKETNVDGMDSSILSNGNKGLFDGYRIRKLTPKECWRLMGFDDEAFEKAKAVPMSNTQLYKQAGNSIVVNVLEKIFKNLLKGEKDGREDDKA